VIAWIVAGKRSSFKAFPGFSAAFNSVWPVKPRTSIATIDGDALAKALRIANRNEAIKAAVASM
jgi:hypothetical protein